MGNTNTYHNEDLLYKLFGINAELLIDHAWGWEPCTIAEIKAYKPSTNSLGAYQASAWMAMSLAWSGDRLEYGVVRVGDEGEDGDVVLQPVSSTVADRARQGRKARMGQG